MLARIRTLRTRAAGLGGGPIACLGLALAVALLLNLGLSFQNAWPGIGIRPGIELSIEATLLVLAVAALASWPSLSQAAARRVLGALAWLYLALMIGRYIEVSVPALFGRPINLYWDGHHIPALIRQAALALPTWAVIAAAAGIALGLWALRRVIRMALQLLYRQLRPRSARLAIAAVAAAIVAGFVLVDSLQSWYARPVVQTLANQLGFVATATSPARLAAQLPQSPSFDGDLGRVAGDDVYLIFVESYGASTFDRPEFAAALAPHRQAMARRLAAAGHYVVSARVRSPTFGGASWLAHAGLLSGLDMNDPQRYDLLLTTSRSTLVELFRRHAYRTVALMPGLRSPWPEGRFYGFDRIYDRDAIGYRGPSFGFWEIPDQYAVAHFHRHEVAARQATDPPLFVFFPTITSHIPFQPLPPVLENWQMLDDADAYRTPEVAAAVARAPDWTRLTPAYLASIAYSLDWVGAYLTQLPHRGPLAIIIGDHQPVAAVAGREASWDVPVHIVSGRRDLAQRFIAAGFCVGLQPATQPLGDLTALTRLLIELLDSRAPVPPAEQVVQCPASSDASLQTSSRPGSSAGP